MGNVRVAPAFASPPLVYRTGEVQYSSDFYNAFIAEPGPLLGASMAEWLDRAGPFKTVSQPGGPVNALNTRGVLNIQNGTVKANNVRVGASSVTNIIAMNNGTLLVTNTLATNASGIFLMTMTNSTLGLTITDTSRKGVVQTLTTGGPTNVIQLASVPVFGSYPVQFPLIRYTTLNGAGSTGDVANEST